MSCFQHPLLNRRGGRGLWVVYKGYIIERQYFAGSDFTVTDMKLTIRRQIFIEVFGRIPDLGEVS